VALFPNERVAFVTRGMRTPLWVDATVGISVGQLGLGHMQQIKSRFDKLLTGRRQEPKDKRVSGRQVACVSSDHAPVTLAPCPLALSFWPFSLSKDLCGQGPLAGRQLKIS